MQRRVTERTTNREGRTSVASTGQSGFHFESSDDDCRCPIHRNGEPFTMPLGVRFADGVHVESIPRRS